MRAAYQYLWGWARQGYQPRASMLCGHYRIYFIWPTALCVQPCFSTCHGIACVPGLQTPTLPSRHAVAPTRLYAAVEQDLGKAANLAYVASHVDAGKAWMLYIGACCFHPLTCWFLH